MSRRAGFAAKVREAALYYGVRSGIAALQTFPVDQNVRTLRAVGGIYATARMNRHRLQRATDNLAWCFPEWSPEQVRTHAIDSYRRLFALAAEVAYTPRLITDDGWAERVRLGDMSHGLRRLLSPKERGGGPMIFITAHCGNWEILGYTLAALGFPMSALYRPLDLEPLDRWVRETRARRGLGLIGKFGAMKEAPETLARGEHLAFTADQNAGDRGVFVPYFGRLASSYKSIGLLAMRFRAPIVCGFARAVGRDPAKSLPLDEQRFKYEIEATDEIDPSEWTKHPDPLFYITARYRRAIETMVRRSPEQYLWMHRYWKARAPHEREGRPFPPRLRDKLRTLPWMTEADISRVEARSAQDTEEYHSKEAVAARRKKAALHETPPNPDSRIERADSATLPA